LNRIKEMRQQFLQYTLVTEIQVGPTSATYLALSEQYPTQKIFLKTLARSSFADRLAQPAMLERMDILKQLRHPHLVPVLETGIEDDWLYIASEYMPGGSLRVRLDRAHPQTLPLQQASAIILQIGQALAMLHAMQIVHDHLTPEHILFDANGQALLSDVSPATDPLPGQGASEKIAYSLNYRAPEQLLQERGDALSDQYALCCIAYELFTGRTPFVGTNAATYQQRLALGNPASLQTFVPDIPATIDAALLRGLSADPSQRHPDISALLALLQPAFTPAPLFVLPLPRSKRAKNVSLQPAPSSKNTLQPVQKARSSPASASPSVLNASALDTTLISSAEKQPVDELALLLAADDPFASPAVASALDDEAEFDILVQDLSHQEKLFLASTQPDTAQTGQQFSNLLPGATASVSSSSGGAVLKRGNRQFTLPVFQSLPFASGNQRTWHPWRVLLWAAVILLLVGSLIGYSLLVNLPTPSPTSLSSTPTARATGTTGTFVVQSATATATATRGTGTGSAGRPTPTATAGSTPTPTVGSIVSNKVVPTATSTPTLAPTPTPSPTPTPVTVVSTLSGSYHEYNSGTNLTSVGTSDWVHWGYGTNASAVDRKATGANLISNYSLLKGGTVSANGSWPIDFYWSDGTPVSSVSSAVTTTSCIYVSGLDNGFVFSVPASTKTRTLYVYVGVYKGTGRLTASIQGGTTYSNASLNMTTDPNLADNALYQISFSSNVVGTRLFISWMLQTDDGTAGNVQLESVALSG
jgi:serine/threonine protein kinase